MRVRMRGHGRATARADGKVQQDHFPEVGRQAATHRASARQSTNAAGSSRGARRIASACGIATTSYIAITITQSIRKRKAADTRRTQVLCQARRDTEAQEMQAEKLALLLMPDGYPDELRGVHNLPNVLREGPPLHVLWLRCSRPCRAITPGGSIFAHACTRFATAAQTQQRGCAHVARESFRNA